MKKRVTKIPIKDKRRPALELLVRCTRCRKVQPFITRPYLDYDPKSDLPPQFCELFVCAGCGAKVKSRNKPVQNGR